MPRGVRKSLADKFYDLARSAPLDEVVSALAEMFTVSLKDSSPRALHNLFGEMNVRAQTMFAELQALEAEAKATRKYDAAVARKVKPKSIKLIADHTNAQRKEPGPKPGVKRVVKRAPRKTK